MTPTVAIARANRPPAPVPCTARAATSWPMLCESPQRTEPKRKIEIATMYSRRRPWMSPSFPYNGTVTAIAST